jgi:hypothetical protein
VHCHCNSRGSRRVHECEEKQSLLTEIDGRRISEFPDIGAGASPDPTRWYVVGRLDDARSGLDLIAILHLHGQSIADMNIMKTEPEVADYEDHKPCEYFEPAEETTFHLESPNGEIGMYSEAAVRSRSIRFVAQVPEPCPISKRAVTFEMT